MAARGRLHTADRDSVIPSDADLETAQSALDLGRLYGYSEDDIAHYYSVRRRDQDLAYIEYVRDLEQAKVAPAAPAASESPSAPTEKPARAR